MDNNYLFCVELLISGAGIAGALLLSGKRGIAVAGEVRKIWQRKKVYICMFVFSLSIFWLLAKHSFNSYNNFSYLADAILKGRIDVPDMPEWLEYVSFRGKKYMHFAPGPALLCIPFVLLMGIEKFNITYLTMILAACNLPLSYKILDNLAIGRKKDDRIWLSIILVFGTVHFFCATQGSSWYLGHVSTLFYLLLAGNFLTGTTGKDESCNFKFFLSGMFFGLAVTCRLSALFGFIPFLGYIIIYSRENWCKKCLLFGCGAAVFGSLYMIYNYVRYGTIMDMGYSLTYLKDYHRTEYDFLQNAPYQEQKKMLKEYQKQFGGPLQLQFIRYNLYSIFFLPPVFQKEFPYIIPTMDGVAITYTSPILYSAVRSDTKKKITWILWGTVLLTAMPFLLNYGNGRAQFGMRYSMDFTPYLWLLTCMALTRSGSLKLWMKIGIGICVFVQSWGAIYWRCFY